MAIAFKIRVGHLLAELLADTFVFFRPLQAAGTVPAGLCKTFLNGFDDLAVIV